MEINLDRWSLYPLKHPDLFEMYKKAVSAFWTVEAIDLSRDYHDFQDKLNSKEQAFIERILSFFQWGDGLVNENLFTHFFQEIVIPEARLFYAVQGMMEAIHQESYALQLQTVVRDEQRRLQLFDMTQSHPSAKAKADFMLKYMNRKHPIEDRLVAFAVVEGIMFSSAFCALFWLKVRNLCHGLTFANEEISKDEALHTEFAVMLRKKIAPPKSQVTRQIIHEGVELEVEFMRNALDVSLLGLSCDNMETYVKFVADHLLVSLDEEPLYKVTNPFPWMDLISLQGQTNFFERRVGEYHKARVAVKPSDMTFRLDNDF